MIVPMQRVTVLCTASSRDSTLDRLRELGVLHIDATIPEEPFLKEAQRAVDDAQEALQLVTNAAGEPDADLYASCPACEEQVRREADQPLPTSEPTVDRILKLGQEQAALEASIDSIDTEIETYRPFGEFDPALAHELRETAGLNLQLFRAPTDLLPVAGKDPGLVKVLHREDHHVCGVAFGGIELDERIERIPAPPRPLSATRRARVDACVRHAAINRMLTAMDRELPRLRDELHRREEQRDVAAVRAGMQAQENILWLTGFCPEERLDALRKTARKEGWGLLAREPRSDEEPPTLLRPPRIFRPVLALFDMLGIVPGYREADISVVFYAFFTLFFAMLISDAGYGALLLAGTLLARRKWRHAPSAPFILMTVFSLATIGWGLLTATYFGIAPARLPGWAQLPTAAWFNEQSNIMQLCFLLGAVHLSVARLWNAALLLPSRKALAQLGWVGIVWTMFCAASMVVVPGFVFPRFMLWVAGGSTLLIALFMLNREELKTEGINLAMLPLNIIGGLGDVISYVRLFAVGLASVKVAENFNEMSLALPLPLWAKIPAVLAILLLGHGLNLAMGALSILVHAVRLNTLEFSNHKGVAWAGFAYRPFRPRRNLSGEPETATGS